MVLVGQSAWRDLAWCRLVPGLPWIAESEDVPEAAAVAMAAVCARCPVVYECMESVGCEGITSGFWAGEDRTPRDATQLGGAA
jgi:hypothetical protein